MKSTKDVVVGDVFDRLTVKNISTKTWGDGSKRLAAFCLCSCGNTKTVRICNLVQENTRSCGCYDIERKLKKKEGYKDIDYAFFNYVKYLASNRKIDFMLTIEEVWSVWEQQNFRCALTGIELVWKSRGKYGREGTASIDRIDSSKPYTKDNIQIIHKWINLMKLDHSQDEFINLCCMVADHKRKETAFAVPLEPDLIG